MLTREEDWKYVPIRRLLIAIVINVIGVYCGIWLMNVSNGLTAEQVFSIYGETIPDTWEMAYPNHGHMCETQSIAKHPLRFALSLLSVFTMFIYNIWYWLALKFDSPM